MGEIQKLQVEKKVKNAGAARCDICEEDRKDCLSYPGGFFGVFDNFICDGCLSYMLKKCKKDVGGNAE